MNKVDVLIIGAGAAGLMCAIEAGKRARKVLLIDHANKAGKKILMSGGGRCNFTNLDIQAQHYISQNPHFCKSALSRYTQWDFIHLVKDYKIPFHEKTHGQLFCDNKSKDILNLLLNECSKNKVDIRLNTSVDKIIKLDEGGFKLKTHQQNIQCESLVIASGGLSIPTMGASPFGYKVAQQFNIPVWPTRAGLVPLTLHTADKEKMTPLSGVSVYSQVSNDRISFTENILFTHRGLSGPAILQISSYWEPGERIRINLLPRMNLAQTIKDHQKTNPKQRLKTLLAHYLPSRLVDTLLNVSMADTPINQLSAPQLELIADDIHRWTLKPNNTEGYRTAEVTLGGVDCHAISSKTMEVTHTPGLYFIGEVLDVTGWLGGYNFQWAWSSGWAAGQAV